MRIIVNDIAASHGGAMTVLKSFYEYVKETDKENEYIFLLSGDYLKECENIKVVLLPSVKKSFFHKLWFDFVSGKRLLTELHPDRVISLQNIITFGYKGNQSVYVHQSIPFQTEKKFSFIKKKERTLAIYQYLIGMVIKKSIKQAKHVFVQAEWMKRNVSSLCHVPKEKIEVVPFAIDYTEEPLHYNGSGKRFFYPATAELEYKNHAVIYEADRILRSENIQDYTITLTLDKENIQNSTIRYCGRLDKEELYHEYTEDVLLFPSYIETIGLPLIEAMEVGALIIAADCEYSREVLKGYSNVAFFDPFSPNELAALMKSCITGEFVVDGQTKRRNHGESSWKKLIDSIVDGEMK